MFGQNASSRCASVIALLAIVVLPCSAAQVVVDICNPATGLLRQVAYNAPASSPRCVPVAPWIMRDPQVRRELQQRPRPLGVDDPTFSPVYQARQTKALATPVTGTWRALVLLVDFSDQPPWYYAGKQGKTHFTKLLFSKDTFPTGSMRDWYQEVSYKAFDIVGWVTGGANGWFRAPQPLSYYADNQRGFGSYPRNTQGLVEDVVKMADPVVNYSYYDNDHDGSVDALIVVHAGPGYETTGDLGKPHSCTWAIPATIRDGVRVSMFTIQPEDGNIGVFGHEFGHALGLPDLYDTTYHSAGVGQYSMMAFGTWAGGGKRPVHFDAYCKDVLGWSHPTAITTTQYAAPVPQAETSPAAYRLWAGGQSNSQYFLVENRQKVGFDAGLPAAGLLIWHIDQNGDQTKPWYPPMSDVLGHYLVALEQADGLWSMERNDDYGDADDAFPGLKTHRTFNVSTTPNSSAYSGYGATHVTVSHISNSGPNMTADLSVINRAPGQPARLTITPANPVRTSELTATATATSDLDGDPLTYLYTWSKWDGRAWGAWAHASVDGRLTGVMLRPDEQWKARVRVSDGTVYGAVRYSTPVTIGSGSPAQVAALTVTAAAAPAEARGAAIVVNLSSPAAVEVEIRNLAGRLVCTLPPQDLGAGVSNLLWNGTSAVGTAAPGGTYLLKVVARGSAGAQAQALASLSVKR